MRMVSARFDDEQIARIDRIAEALGKKVPGVKVSRGDAIRAVAERGVVSFEEELDLAGQSPA
jgi:hypothetical protein